MTTMVNPKMKIGFDIDGTMISNSSIYKIIQSLFPQFDGEKHYKYYPISESLLQNGFIECKQTFGDIFDVEEYHPILFGEGEFLEGFTKFYNYLLENGNEIYFVTARRKSAEPMTKELFEKLGIEYKNVFHIEGYDKSEKLNELGIDIFFEDNVGNIEILLEKSKCDLVLIDAPYNREYVKNNERVKDLRSWENIYNFYVKN